MKNFIILIIGAFLGMGFMFYLTKANTLYWTLEEDCIIEDIGYIKKGTLLRVDEGMSEGFTRCILYLNLKGIEVTVDSSSNKDYSIRPYWLRSNDKI